MNTGPHSPARAGLTALTRRVVVGPVTLYQPTTPDRRLAGCDADARKLVPSRAAWTLLVGPLEDGRSKELVGELTKSRISARPASLSSQVSA